METSTLTLAAPKAVEYPTRDGKPMAETDKHAELGIYVREALKDHYRHRSDAYVSGNNFVFWQEGDPKLRVSPDAYVVFGPSGELRDSYKAWEEGGHLPAVVFEFTSKKTQAEDVYTKLPLYEQTLRTPEYFLFDPRGDYLWPRLQGFRLVDGRYVRLEMVEGRLHSETLALDLVQEGETLRLYDPALNEPLLTSQEKTRRLEAGHAALSVSQAEAQAEHAARLAAEARAEAERANRAAADAEIARLRAEIEALRSHP